MINFIYALPLPLIALIIISAIYLWYLINKHSKYSKLFNIVLLIISLLAIIYITLLRRSRGNYNVILKPFYTFILAKDQKEYYREMLMNIFLFVPLGLSLPFVLSYISNRGIVVKTIVMGLLLSIVIEYCQFYFCIGTCEIDDVIMNTLGVVVGCSCYRFYRQ